MTGSCECQPGLTECDGACVNTDGDADHCGQCGMDCGNQVCADAMCADDCGGLEQCGNSCADFDTDPLNCGECGQVCGNDELCIEGECVDGLLPDCNSCPCDDCAGFDLCCDVEGVGISCLEVDECP